MPYTRPYASGFVDYPSTTTPINSTALNTMDVGIKTANDQFQTVTTAQRAALSPTVGQAVWDSDLKQLMVFMNASGGNAWQPVGNTIICASTTRPASPFAGQRIFETDSKRWWTYIGSAWVPDDLVFTNEAARDAAITSPTEGMTAYLTAPTIPAATGVETYVPTGVQTIYNGSVWVCVSEVGAFTSDQGNTTSTSYTATLNGGNTNPSVTLVTGTTVLITLSASMTTNGGTNRMGIAVSGASTIAASDAKGIRHEDLSNAAANESSHGATLMLTGLTAGTNTFTLQYKHTVIAGNTSYLRNRMITARGIA